MNHGITDQQWVEFTEGSAAPALRERIAQHLNECVECAAEITEQRRWTERLELEGARLREALALPAAQREQMLAVALQRIAADAPAKAGVGERLALLRTLLNPVLGKGTVRAAMETALGRAAPEGITASNWEEFGRMLSETVQPVCGLTAAMLAGRAAMSLAATDAGGRA